MSEMAIFVGFCLLTRKLFFFLQVLKLFLDSAGPIRPPKPNNEVLITPKQVEPRVQRRGDVFQDMYAQFTQNMYL